MTDMLRISPCPVSLFRAGTANLPCLLEVDHLAKRKVPCEFPPTCPTCDHALSTDAKKKPETTPAPP